MSYAASTRHPWACLVFLVPILAVYELGLLWLGGGYRNGADAWLRWGLETYGLQPAIAAPLIVVGWFLFMSIVHWKDRPEGLPGILFGMLAESCAFGFVLWLISRNFPLILSRFGL